MRAKRAKKFVRKSWSPEDLAIRLVLCGDLVRNQVQLVRRQRLNRNLLRLKRLEDQQHFRRWDFRQGMFLINKRGLDQSRAKLKGKLWHFKRICRRFGWKKDQSQQTLRLAFFATFGRRPRKLIAERLQKQSAG